MDKAAKECNITDVDFVKWTDSWLKTAGCNVIKHEIQEADGKIQKFSVKQSCHENGDTNQLRVQKY